MKKVFIHGVKKLKEKLKFSQGGGVKKVFGVVTPLHWGSQGEVLKYSIYTPMEEDITILNHEEHPYLEDHLRRAVYAYGKIKINEDGEKEIVLSRIKIPKKAARADFYFHEMMRKFYRKTSSLWN
jgi:hypothetical protein